MPLKNIFLPSVYALTLIFTSNQQVSASTIEERCGEIYALDEVEYNMCQTLMSSYKQEATGEFSVRYPGSQQYHTTYRKIAANYLGIQQPDIIQCHYHGDDSAQCGKERGTFAASKSCSKCYWRI